MGPAQSEGLTGILNPIKAGTGKPDLAPPWSRKQVQWIGTGYFILRLATQNESRWLLGAEVDARRVLPHERTFRRLAEAKSEVIRNIGMNPWPVHMAGEGEPRKWRQTMSQAVEGVEPVLDTGHIALWRVDRLGPEAGSFASSLVALDGHHSRRAQMFLGSKRIFGWIEPLSSPQLEVWPIHRAGNIAAWIDQMIAAGELKKIKEPPVPGGWSLGSSLSFEVVKGDRRFWCAIAKPRRIETSQGDSMHETVVDALVRLARESQVRFRTGVVFDEMLGLLQRAEVDAVLKLPPPTKELVRARAVSGALFPQKATSFQKKIPFGLLVRDLS